MGKQANMLDALALAEARYRDDQEGEASIILAYWDGEAATIVMAEGLVQLCRTLAAGVAMLLKVRAVEHGTSFEEEASGFREEILNHDDDDDDAGPPSPADLQQPDDGPG